MIFNMSPLLTVDKHKQVKRNPMMSMAPNLTWINKEQKRARYMIAMGMTADQDPISADLAAPPVLLDALAADMQFAPMTILRQIRSTSTIVFPGAHFSWVNMRIHTGHGRAIRPGTCQTEKTRVKSRKSMPNANLNYKCDNDLSCCLLQIGMGSTT